MEDAIDPIMDKANMFFNALPFSVATWFVLATLIFFVWLFVRASKNPSNPIKWEHLIIDSNNDRASPYKVGYLIGLIVGTWTIVTLIDHDKLTFDMFGLYLTYLLGGAGVNSFVKQQSDAQRMAYNDQYGQSDQHGRDDQNLPNRRDDRRRDLESSATDVAPRVEDVI